jgi:hypothetical protein
MPVRVYRFTDCTVRLFRRPLNGLSQNVLLARRNRARNAPFTIRGTPRRAGAQPLGGHAGWEEVSGDPPTTEYSFIGRGAALATLALRGSTAAGRNSARLEALATRLARALSTNIGSYFFVSRARTGGPRVARCASSRSNEVTNTRRNRQSPSPSREGVPCLTATSVGRALRRCADGFRLGRYSLSAFLHVLRICERFI